MPPKTLEIPEQLNSRTDGWPSLVDMKVILPGPVFYEDLNNGKGATVLVRKPALDRMAASLEGRPIINWDHRSVDPKDFSRGKAQGIIVGPALFNATDGWYHAQGYVWDEATKRNIENGYSISCAYKVKQWSEGEVMQNMVPYAREVLDGEYTHIAVVPVPRYEGARIDLLNSKGGPMGLLSFFRKDKEQEKLDIDTEKTTVAVEGLGDVSVAELVNSHKAAVAAKGATTVKLADDDLIEVDGKKVSLKELKNSHLMHVHNATEKDHTDGKHSGDENFKDNCANCMSERKNAEDAKAADEQKKKEDKETEERKNAAATEAAAKAEADRKAQELENARNKERTVEMPEVPSIYKRMAEGQTRYGSGQ